MKAQVSGIYDNSNVNGIGLRSVIFMSGCYFNCPECHNKDVQDPNSGISMSIEEIVDRIKSNIPIIDGVTISGGEPSLQSEQVIEIAKHTHELGLDVWMYSGDTYENLLEHKRSLLESIDVLVDGRFVKDLYDANLLYKGSSNQRIIDCKKSLQSNSVVLLDL